MKWPWEANRRPVPAAPPTSDEPTAGIEASLANMSSQLARFGRLQYKGTTELLAALQQVEATLERHTRREAELVVLAEQRESARHSLVAWLDSLDAVDEMHDSPFGPLFQEWRAELVEALGRLGLAELSVLGRPFDPEWADGVSTVAPGDADGTPPYAVVQVVRRGFREGDRIYRKARVVTVAAPPESRSGGELDAQPV